jgi:predicted amidohydrolase YtcJ
LSAPSIFLENPASSACAGCSDARVGTLAADKLADLAVLLQDIFTVPLETIADAHNVTTMVGGKIVYSAPP